MNQVYFEMSFKILILDNVCKSSVELLKKQINLNNLVRELEKKKW